MPRETPHTPQVILRSIGGTQMQMITTTGKHSFIIDEPTERGGEDLSASPFEFFAASYAG